MVNELEVISIARSQDLDEAVQRVSQLLRPGARLIVKLGPAGALGQVDGTRQHHASDVASGIFDTVGAGDSFNTGYLAACLQGAGLHDALAAGCRTAAAILLRFPRKRIAAGELAHCLQSSS